MRNAIPKICLYAVFILSSFYSYSQNRTIDSLKKVLTTEKEDTDKVNTLNELGIAAMTISDTNAMTYSNEAVSLSEKINFKKGKATGLNNIGRIYFGNGNYFEALKQSGRAMRLWEDVGSSQGIADSYFLAGDAYQLLENYAESMKNYYLALKRYENLGDKQHMSKIYQYIGALFSYQNNNDEAIKNFEIALKIRQQIGDSSGSAQSYNGIGQTYAKMGKYEEALKMDSAGLKIYNDLGRKAPRWGLPFSLANIGNVFDAEGEIANAAGNKSVARDKFKLAVDNYLLTLKLWEQIGRKDGISQTYNYLGSTYVKLQNIALAKNYFDKALAINKVLNIKSTLKYTYYNLVQVDSIDKNYRQAFQDYLKYILYRDSLVNEDVTKRSLQSQMQYDFDKKESITKAEQDKKDEYAKRIKNQQYFIIGGLGIIVLAVLIISLIQFRNNKHKQKANLLLETQKQKVETTLSELRSAQSQLIQSEKMASLGELTAGIAHEIQNPLNFVNNFSEVNKELISELKEEIKKGNIQEVNAIAGDIEANEEKINHHGKRAEAIVKGMLQHSRSSNGVKEPTDINSLADEYLRLSYHGSRAKDKEFNATIKTDFDENIGKINIIPQDIGRVLLNLYNNAFYAVAEKAKQQPNGYEPVISVSTKKKVNKIIITVRDNGNGIPQKVVDKIFQPFFTTKPTGQGTGLGLSLSYDIIKAHGGEIKVETKEGEFTEFIIQLPIST